MTTPPRGEADDPAPPRRETGLGWPDERPPARPKPPAPPQRPQRPQTPERRHSRPAPPRTAPVRQIPSPRYAPPRPRSYEPPERPGTVTAAAVILFVSAGLGLLACCGLNLMAGEAGVSSDVETYLAIFSVILVAVSVFNAVLGYYLLQGRQWARITTIVVCGLGIAGSVIAVFAGANGGNNIASSCVGLLLNVLVIGLLSGSQASDYFRYGRR